jgi:hypothetical protein
MKRLRLWIMEMRIKRAMPELAARWNREHPDADEFVTVVEDPEEGRMLLFAPKK